MLPTLNIGPLALPTAGLVYILGIWFSLSVVEWAAKRLQSNPQTMYGLAVTAVFAAFVAARLAFVVEYWAAFRENLLGIVWPLNSGYTVWVGVLAGIIAAFFYGRFKQLSPAATLDVLAPGLLIGLFAISLADFLAGPGFGDLTKVPWAISQYGMRRHPVQVYEMLIGLGALWVWWQVAQRRMFEGQAVLVTAVFYAIGRLFVDAYRANAWLTADGYHVWQFVYLAVLVGSLVLLARQRETAV